MHNKELEQFYDDFRHDIIARSEVEGEEVFREEMFTQTFTDYLKEAGEVDDVNVCSFRSRGMAVNGYSVSEDEETLHLFISDYSHEVDITVLTKSVIDDHFRRLATYAEKCFGGLYKQIEEASPAHDMAMHIHDVGRELTQIRLYLMTNQLVKPVPIGDIALGDITVSHHVWDIDRLYRFVSSGKSREAVEIDLDNYGGPIPCLEVKSNEEYSTLLAVVPGGTLMRMYADLGPRLLERNVRSFLQARGSVNKGIRTTILNEPHRFMAYNNGLSGTAEAVKVIRLADGSTGIQWLKDFQIVNGGQTTASLYNTSRKDKSDLHDVFVQMKLTVVNNMEDIDEIVPKISQYANSQNKIQTADFSANDPFHRKLEELSRSIWAPSKSGSERQTRWFYERARGQYSDAREKENTPARKKAWEKSYPRKQMFTKTDVAKYENIWGQLPHIVTRGAQKNFNEFTIQLQKRGRFLPDQRYFEHLVAKAILFKATEQIVREQKYPGYRANIVAYTLAILSHKTAQRIDFGEIWKNQSISPDLEEVLKTLVPVVQEELISSAGSSNVTEWSKKEACWKHMMNLEVTIPDAVIARHINKTTGTGIEAPSEEESEEINYIKGIPAQYWFDLCQWAKETNNLQAWQRSLAYSLGSLAKRGREPSRKQAIHGRKIIDESRRLGFALDVVSIG